MHKLGDCPTLMLQGFERSFSCCLNYLMLILFVRSTDKTGRMVWRTEGLARNPKTQTCVLVPSLAGGTLSGKSIEALGGVSVFPRV